MFTFYQQLVVQRRGETQPSQLLQLILMSLPRPLRHFQRTCTVFQPVVQFLMLFVVIAIFHTFKTLLSRSGNVWTGRPGSSARGLVSEVAWGWRNQKTVSCCFSSCYYCLLLLLFLFLLRCVLAIWFKKPEYSNKENMNIM